jgi:hypothetical protein
LPAEDDYQNVKPMKYISLEEYRALKNSFETKIEKEKNEEEQEEIQMESEFSQDGLSRSPDSPVVDLKKIAEKKQREIGEFIRSILIICFVFMVVTTSIFIWKK